MSPEKNLAENGSHAFCGGGTDAACKLINCPHFYDESITDCVMKIAAVEMRLQLRKQNYQIKGMSVICGECGTVNGHSDCQNRFGIRVNHLG